MIDREDLKRIINSVKVANEKVLNSLKKDYEIKYIDLKDYEAIKPNIIVSEDSGYISGTVGPFSYIFIKTVVLNSKVFKFSNLYLSNSNFFEYLSISEFAELISKYSEYLFTLKFSKDADLILMDGSIISDLILSMKYFKYVLKKYEVEDVEIEDMEKIINHSYLDNVNVNLVIATFPFLIKRFLEIAKEIPVLYFVKRPIHSKTIAKSLKIENSDVILLSRLKDEFFTDLYDEKFSEMFFNENIKVMYFRMGKYSNIYKIEFPDYYKKEEIIGLIKYLVLEDSNFEGYPKKLEYSHSLSNVTIEDKNSIENLILSTLPEGMRTKEITRYL